MKISKSITSLAVALLTAGATLSFDAVAAPTQQADNLSKNLFNLAYKSKNDRMAFQGNRFDAMQKANELITSANKPSRVAHKEDNATPGLNFTVANSFGDIDAPNGETWFYTLELENNPIYYEYFTDYELVAYTVTIYDSNGKEVGSIHDKMKYEDDELVYAEEPNVWHHRVPMCEVLQVLTTNFFNDTPDIEVVIAFAVNTPKHINKYRSIAYSLGGEKDDEGNDKPVGRLDEIIADVLHYTDAAGNSNYYMSTIKEGGGHFDGSYPEGMLEGEEYWNRLNSYGITIDTYKHADATGAPQKINSFKIPLQQLPGDQESGGYVLSGIYNGAPYMIFSMLNKSLTEPYYSADSETMTQRAENTLDIYVYKIENDEFKQTQLTQIPFTKDNDDDVLFTYYGIGSLRWNLDVDFDHYNTPEGQAAFTVCKCNYRISSDGVSGYTFYLFDNNGNRKTTIAKEVDGYIAMSDVKGKEPQEMFVIYDNGYVYKFIDLYTFANPADINANFAVDEYSDPELIMTTLDRVPFGDSYKYVAEMRYPVEDEGDTYMRFIWLNANGSFDRIDHINIGENVYYAMGYISADAMDPKLFHSDDAQEYMVLIKRGIDETGETSKTQEELVIGQPRCEEYPNGRTLLHLTPDATRGALGQILPYINDKTPRLAISYSGSADAPKSVDFYYLPLDGPSAGIDEIVVDAPEAGINGDGAIYNLQGIRVAKPANGLYIINGKKVIF